MTRARAVTASVAAGIACAVLAPLVVIAGVSVAVRAAWEARKTTTKGTK